MINRQWLLASHPTGAVDRSHFQLTQSAVPPSPGDNKVLLQNEMLLCAPTIRNWISGNRSSYYPAVEIGAPVMAPGVGRVVSSEDERYPAGARLVGTGSWQDYQWVNPEHGYRVLPEAITTADALGIFGMNALTAYFGVLDVCRPQSGEVMLVSGAAGSVGSLAVQIGRILGARVIGICGGADKVAWLKEDCGIAEVIDYKSEDVADRLDTLCPDGIDVFFDNVGGNMLRDVVARTRRHGRIALCGQIATYDAAADNPPLDMMRIIYGAIRLQGFLVFDYATRMSEALGELAKWNDAGLVAHREDIRDGFERLPETFASLFSGSNNGTLIARIADEEGNAL